MTIPRAPLWPRCRIMQPGFLFGHQLILNHHSCDDGCRKQTLLAKPPSMRSDTDSLELTVESQAMLLALAQRVGPSFSERRLSIISGLSANRLQSASPEARLKRVR